MCAWQDTDRSILLARGKPTAVQTPCWSTTMALCPAYCTPLKTTPWQNVIGSTAALMAPGLLEATWLTSSQKNLCLAVLPHISQLNCQEAQPFSSSCIPRWMERKQTISCQQHMDNLSNSNLHSEEKSQQFTMIAPLSWPTNIRLLSWW